MGMVGKPIELFLTVGSKSCCFSPPWCANQLMETFYWRHTLVEILCFELMAYLLP